MLTLGVIVSASGVEYPAPRPKVEQVLFFNLVTKRVFSFPAKTHGQGLKCRFNDSCGFRDTHALDSIRKDHHEGYLLTEHS